jgi:uncharacterized protein DUF6308
VNLDDLGWPRPDQAELQLARSAAFSCLEDEDAASLALAQFYDPQRGYAARTFLELQPVDPWDITASDLLAVTTLNVTAAPLAIRRLLGCGSLDDGPRRKVLAALAAVGDQAELADADAQMLQAAALLYTTVKTAIGTNPWVITSKLCARKRPALIPVRDKVVVAELGLTNRDFRTDWLVYRHLLGQHDLVEGLLRVTHKATAEYKADLSGLPILRLLDTILWKMRPKTRRIGNGKT